MRQCGCSSTCFAITARVIPLKRQLIMSGPIPHRQLTAALSEFEILGRYAELTTDAPGPETQRVFYVCKRKE